MKRHVMLTVLSLAAPIASAAPAAAGSKSAGTAYAKLPRPVSDKELAQAKGEFMPIVIGAALSVGVGVAARTFSGQKTTVKDLAIDAASGAVGGVANIGSRVVGRTIYTTSPALKSAAPTVDFAVGAVAAETTKEVLNTRWK